MVLWSRLTISAILLFSGIAKVLGDGGPGAILPPGMALFLGVLEILAGALMLAGRFLSVMAYAMLILAIVGVSLALFFPQTPCGCYGDITVPPPIRLALSATLGIGSILVLDAHTTARSKTASLGVGGMDGA